jgi:glutaredoxin
MKTTGIVLAIAGCALACAAAAQSNVYRWVDKDGKVQFSDAPPPDDAANVTQKRMGGATGDDPQLPFATQLCSDGRALLSSRGIPFTERNAEANPEDAEKLKELAGALQVPFLTVGERRVKGFDAGNWNSALDGAGYPRTRLPGQTARQPDAK